ncbi:hypothetical protein KI688_012934 [Linnemannia hyalina]|uniref:Uncharacterized protein n=1 Tax=Linnemannia hyalina TaxID=64524 RepID=A0A9P7XTV7_9FUNG|nr:hypothetical protein KI688_012934 [Linnemannia hyalina]
MRAPASWMKSLLATATCLASIASIAQADILCSSPNSGQTFKAGDPVSLAITASATGGPFVAQVNSLTATLVCTVAGNILDTVTIPKANVTGYNYIIPSVGNVTTPTGTDGVCVTNKFYFSYSGKYTDDGIFPIPHDFGPAKCADITIVPQPYPVIPIPSPNITTTAATIPTPTPTDSTTGKPKSTTTTSSSLSPSPTSGNKDESESDGRPKTFIVVVVAIVAVVLLALMAVGIMFHLRRQRKRRMESAIMPWSNQNNNQFSKMSSSMDDDDPRSPGSHHAAAIGGGIAAAGAVGAGFNKPQPKTPQPSHGGHYGDDSYGGGGYGQQQQHGHGGYYNDQDGYGQQQQDDFYNPYYAQHAGGGGGYQGAPGAAGAAGAAAAGGYGYRNDKQSYYAGSQGARTPYQESHDPYSSASPVSSATGAGSAGGYYPPPPPVSSNAAGALSPPTPSSSYLNSAPNELSSTTLTNSSGTGRAPQAILPEMGHSESGDAAGGGIPMKEIPPK